MNNRLPVIIVGMPRSGTTWIGNIFGTAKGCRLILEPDNEKTSPLAWLYKNDLHRFPYLTAQDRADSYEKLWRVSLTGGSRLYFNSLLRALVFRRRLHALEAAIGERTGFSYTDETYLHVASRGKATPYRVDDHPLVAWLIEKILQEGGSSRRSKRLIVKSVHAPLCIEWIASRFSVKLVVVLRNPYNVFASYKRMRMPDSFRNLLIQDTLQRDLDLYLSKQGRVGRNRADCVAFQIMLMLKVMSAQIQCHPEWIAISHDRLCIAPEENYKRVFRQLGLVWSGDVVEKINLLNRPDTGFKPIRISSLQPSKWRGELSTDEKKTIDRWIAQFDLANFLSEYVLV